MHPTHLSDGDYATAPVGTQVPLAPHPRMEGVWEKGADQRWHPSHGGATVPHLFGTRPVLRWGPPAWLATPGGYDDAPVGTLVRGSGGTGTWEKEAGGWRILSDGSSGWRWTPNAHRQVIRWGPVVGAPVGGPALVEAPEPAARNDEWTDRTNRIRDARHEGTRAWMNTGQVAEAVRVAVERLDAAYGEYVTDALKAQQREHIAALDSLTGEGMAAIRRLEQEQAEALSSVRQTLDDAREALERERANHRDLITAHDAMRERCADAEHQRDEVSESVETLARQAEDLEAKLEDRRARIEDLDRQRHNLHNRLDEVLAQRDEARGLLKVAERERDAAREAEARSDAQRDEATRRAGHLDSSVRAEVNVSETRGRALSEVGEVVAKFEADQRALMESFASAVHRFI